ncbi:hypothetical protein O181_082437 [Austropuccinia psidii MF-1]|uniref:Uncharacterized protein n=1 Tax=Austropuccinia psidii MF-1 TaxID=1389203 RepID=A0A9Q3FQF5_9BASI|nr:hypothetical protein [Austropuccinia psidii MF-1]
MNRDITPTQNEHNVVTPEKNAINCQCNQIFTLDDLANTLKDVRKRKNIVNHSPYKSRSFKKKQPFRVKIKDKPKERVAEVTKNKTSCHNFGSTDHYANNFPKGKKKVSDIEQVPEEESPTKDSSSDSMVNAIIENSDDSQDPREEFLVDWQEETPLEIQDIQLEAEIPQDTANKSLCKHTQYAQTFQVTSPRAMAYIHGSATKMSLFIDNTQHPLWYSIPFYQFQEFFQKLTVGRSRSN